MRFIIRFILCIILLSGISGLVTTSDHVQPVKAQEGDSQFPITITDARGKEVTIESIEAVVSGSGDVTEIIAALGLTENLIAIDDSSVYPENLQDELPSIGFARRLTLDPIIAQAPTVFLCSLTCSPTTVIEQVEELGIPVVIVPDIVPGRETSGLELPLEKISMIAEALGVSERGDILKQKVATEIDWAKTAVANVEESPYVFFIYLRGRGLQLVAGEGVPSQYLIEGVGAIDAGVDIGIMGYQSLSPEVILSAFPDYIILMERSVETAGGLDTVREIQGIRQTPAGQNDNFIVMEEQYLLGMSTRTGLVMLDLANQLHPSMTWEYTVESPYTITDTTGEDLTIEAETPVAATESVYSTVLKLGFHPVNIASVEPGMTIITTEADDFETWRAQGYTVIVVENTIESIATALNVPGRGKALIAQNQ